MGGALFSSRFLLVLLLSLFQPSRPMNTVVVDGLAQWKTTTLHLGDSLVFKHQNLRNIYLFHNRRAFELCNFAQATQVYGGESTQFTWHPARPGNYYFATRDESGSRCEQGSKVPVRVVIAPDPSPSFSPVSAPAPMSGGDLPALPSQGWISGSPSHSSSQLSPSPAAEASGLLIPGKGTAPAAPPRTAEPGGGIPFISSNPAVPLPTGETDSATILPLPSPGADSKVAGVGSSTEFGMPLLVLVMTTSFGLLG